MNSYVPADRFRATSQETRCVAFAEQFHPGAVNRSANPLVAMEGPAAVTKGCSMCHAVGKPNADGSIGTCTACHARHSASVELARMPDTCGQCHMGPDHSQIEIYHESKHGVIFNAQKGHYRYFDLWHYYGRTAKHGAFMGGADFVQWHGYYEIVARLAEIKRFAAELRDKHAHTTSWRFCEIL